MAAALHPAYLHTSPYVTIRHHTAPYVSIREHTQAMAAALHPAYLAHMLQAYVSIRQEHTAA